MPVRREIFCEYLPYCIFHILSFHHQHKISANKVKPFLRKAKEFLLEILADGGMAQKKIEEEAEKLGIKKKTLRNAKMELGIDSVKRGNQWYWMLSE